MSEKQLNLNLKWNPAQLLLLKILYNPHGPQQVRVYCQLKCG